MAAEKGKEIVLPGVLINELGDLKRKLESQGMSPGLKQEFADLKQKFDASATAARDAGDTGLSKVFVKDVSPLVKEVEKKLSEKTVETLPRSRKSKWAAFAEQDQNVVRSSESIKEKSTEKAEVQKHEPLKLSFRMGAGRGGPR